MMYNADARSEDLTTTVSEARQMFAELVNRVAYGGLRITIARHGRDLVAVVPMADLRRLEVIEAAEAAGVADAHPTAPSRQDAAAPPARAPRLRSGPRA